MDTAFVRQAGTRDRLVEDLLAGTVGHRLPLIARTGKNPAALGSVRPPIVFQLAQQPLRQNRVAILAAFALLDPDLPVATINVTGSQMASFIEPQARAINGHQKGPVFGLRTGDEQTLNLSFRIGR